MQLMRNALIGGLAAVGLLGATPVHATDSIVAPMKESDVKSFCDKVGGDFTRAPDGSGYGCKSDCNGSCSVTCSKDNYCVISTPVELRVPTAGFDPRANDYLKLAVASQDDGKSSNDRAGWIGLLGLLGLAGLIGVARSGGRSKPS